MGGTPPDHLLLDTWNLLLPTGGPGRDDTGGDRVFEEGGHAIPHGGGASFNALVAGDHPIVGDAVLFPRGTVGHQIEQHWLKSVAG